MKKIIKWCSHCGKKFEFDVTEEQYKKYNSILYTVKEILPDISIEDNILLEKDICYDCWINSLDDHKKDWDIDNF